MKHLKITVKSAVKEKDNSLIMKENKMNSASAGDNKMKKTKKKKKKKNIIIPKETTFPITIPTQPL